MKTLIAYYSLSGNNELLAQAFQKKMNCDIYKIEEKSSRSRWTIFMDIIFKRTPKLIPTKIDLKSYDRVIFLAPIWLSQIATPLASFIKQQVENLNDYSFATICGGTDGLREKIVPQLSELTGMRPTAYEEFTVDEFIDPKLRESPNAVMNYKITMNDLQKADVRIDRFLKLKHLTEVF